MRAAQRIVAKLGTEQDLVSSLDELFLFCVSLLAR